MTNKYPFIRTNYNHISNIRYKDRADIIDLVGKLKKSLLVDDSFQVIFDDGSYKLPDTQINSDFWDDVSPSWKSEKRDSSLTTITSRIRSIQRALGLSESKLDWSIIIGEKKQHAADLLNNNDSGIALSTRKNTANDFVGLVKSLPENERLADIIDFWTNIRDCLTDEHVVSNHHKKWTPEESVEAGSWKELVQERKLSIDPNCQNWQTNVIVLIYRFIGALRNEDLYHLEWVKSEDASTWFEWNGDYVSKFVRAKGKTTDVHGIMEFSFDKQQSVDLTCALSTLYGLYKKSRWVFPNSTYDSHMTPDYFSKLMKSIFGGRSCDIMRKLYVSQVVSKLEPSERIRASEIMGHTRSTALAVYDKGDDLSPDDTQTPDFGSIIMRLDNIQSQMKAYFETLDLRISSIEARLSSLENSLDPSKLSHTLPQ